MSPWVEFSTERGTPNEARAQEDDPQDRLEEVTPAPKPAAIAKVTLVKATIAKPEPNPAPAGKPAPKRERAEVIPGDAKLTMLVKENPRRAGTLAARTFATCKTGMTVAEWREKVAAADLDPGYLHADLRAGYVKVTLPTLREAAKAEKKEPAHSLQGPAPRLSGGASHSTAGVRYPRTAVMRYTPSP